MNKDNYDNSVDNNELVEPKETEFDIFASDEDAPGVLVLEGESSDEESEEEKSRITTYMPRFTEASEKYRRKGDAKIRERLGIKSIPDVEPVSNPDEISLDPTAEFDADFAGVDEAKAPDNVAIDESDESINVLKFKSPEDELEEEAAKEREEIKKLLGDPKPKEDPKPEPEVVEEEEPEEIEEEPSEEEPKEYDIPDPDEDDFEVFEYSDNDADEVLAKPSAPVAPVKKGIVIARDKEFNNPTQRDSIKDRFLDTLISIRIRKIASFVFALGIFVLEMLCAFDVLKFNLFGANSSPATLGIIDFLLGACLFVMAMPEIVKSVKNLIGKKFTADFLPVPLFIVFGLYTLTIALTGAIEYPLFGILFACVTLPVLTAALYRAKADFIAFKMIAQPEDKQVIDIQNTRDLDIENKALDGAVDEYKSKLSRTFNTSFVSDFFKNSEGGEISLKHAGVVYGIPFGVALVAGTVAFFLASWNFTVAMSVFTIIAMLGCPVFSIVAGRISFFHSQRAALLTDSTAIGEDSYHNFAGVDVFAFEDTDIFGPDDVNLKRFMLYGDRDNMDKIMRQMCALFAAVGGPLDYMFSGIIDNRVRHKTASNVIIEDDGICGEVAGHKICAGSEDYMRRNGIALPPAALGRENGSSLDTIKVMYAAEDGEVNAKFYIRYSFSEEFTCTIPSLRDAGIIPLIYTRDPNISNELLATLTASNGAMRVVKLYNPTNEELGENRTPAGMITYGDKLDAAGMIVLAKKYHRFSLYCRFAEVASSIIAMLLAIGLSFIGTLKFTIIFAALWHVASCAVIRLLSKAVFLKETKRKGEE